MVRRGLSRLCFKTKVCMFYKMHSCSKGEACSFVHDEAEQQPLPNLARTKLCPNFLNQGVCTDPACNYAHTRRELRSEQENNCIRDAAEVEAGLLEQVLSAGGGGPAFYWEGKLPPPPVPPVPQFHPTVDVIGNQALYPLVDEDDDPQLALHRSVTPSTDVPTDFDSMSQAEADKELTLSRQTTEATLGGEEAASGIDPTRPKSRNKFFKTKMCVYYGMGMCRKTASCSFAHSPEELRPSPDLRRTKPCPVFLETGFCSNGQDCVFAHSQEELRQNPCKSKASPTTVAFPGVGTAFRDDASEPSPASHQDTLSSMAEEAEGGFQMGLGMNLVVKNTFLSVDTPTPTMRRSSSEPTFQCPEVEWTPTLTGGSWREPAGGPFVAGDQPLQDPITGSHPALPGGVVWRLRC